jgi:lipooligosaccharide transport system permease protein
MPIYLQPIGWISPFWHSAELGRTLSYGAEMSAGMFAIHVSYLLFLVVVGLLFTYPKFKQRLAK